ncbi:hypothetical protein BS50DRAFT_572885 [Corynespora cassiicola Philippines]|uniref:Homeobox domain-containing protein n=1 Tax=Corynespora cassiicola Philippines TaxID=1448308 RepID=A0A2T2NR87_CORCC|nr:hypothetical protein BS50DRAFT_572885 [Corynespora cassiicola Philippines]
MLSPDGTGLKRSAPSIWSFDSGYGSGNNASNSLEDLLQGQLSNNASSSQGLQHRSHEHAGLGLGFHWTNPVSGLHAKEPLIDPVSTDLSVLTAKDPSNNGFYLPEIPRDGQRCMACEVLRDATLDENIRCEECRIPEIVEPASLRLDTSIPFISLSKESKRNRLSKLDTTTRCLACEIVSQINPSGPSKCPGCSPNPDFLSPVSPISPCDTKVKRSRAGRVSKLPLSALNRLQEWLDAHQDDPYPSSETKRQLSQECGITEKQVNTWFTNARARQLNPLETYLSSGSEDEAARESDIADAAVTPPYTGGFAFVPENNRYRRAGSVSGSSALSAPQNVAQPSRRGKKKNYRRNNSQSFQPPSTLASPVQETPISAIPTDDQEKLWQCTFCRKHLVQKSWRRHEETQHQARSHWTCLLYGPRVSISSRTATTASGTSICAFCRMSDPSEDHFLTNHRISECVKRPIAERTFFRPDHLRQHVKNFHSATLYDVVQSKWKKSPSKEEGYGNGGKGWMCGFCAEHLETWDKRETHIAGHFKEGRTMDEWTDYPIEEPPSQPHSRNSSREEKQNEHGHSHRRIPGLARLSRTFTGRSTRSSRSTPQPQQPQVMQPAFQGYRSSQQYHHHHHHQQRQQQQQQHGFSNTLAQIPRATFTPLPDINTDPLLIDPSHFPSYPTWPSYPTAQQQQQQQQQQPPPPPPNITINTAVPPFHPVHCNSAPVVTHSAHGTNENTAPFLPPNMSMSFDTTFPSLSAPVAAPTSAAGLGFHGSSTTATMEMSPAEFDGALDQLQLFGNEMEFQGPGPGWGHA